MYPYKQCKDKRLSIFIPRSIQKSTPIVILLLCFVVFSFSSIAVAEASVPDIQAMVKLSHIKAEKTAERGGDELYFNVTTYSSLGQSNTDRVPEKPAHWDSHSLDQLKNIILWEGTIQDKEEVKLIFSLAEQEFPIWHEDELIGGAQLKLKNANGLLEHEWVVPVFEETAEIEMKAKSTEGGNAAVFLMKGANAVYEVAFSLEQKKK